MQGTPEALEEVSRRRAQQEELVREEEELRRQTLEETRLAAKVSGG